MTGKRGKKPNDRTFTHLYHPRQRSFSLIKIRKAVDTVAHRGQREMAGKPVAQGWSAEGGGHVGLGAT